MAEKLFPERQRCKACRGGFGEIDEYGNIGALDGLYCSYRCAGAAEPSKDPARNPRECVTQRDGKWQFKRRFRSMSEVPDKLKNDPSSTQYWCSNCKLIHTGHSRIDTSKEKFRVFRNTREELAETLVKARGKATRKQVAEAAGIRPIRLKEMEEPSLKKPYMPEDLDKVLKVLQMKNGVTFR